MGGYQLAHFGNAVFVGHRAEGQSQGAKGQVKQPAAFLVDQVIIPLGNRFADQPNLLRVEP